VAPDRRDRPEFDGPRARINSLDICTCFVLHLALKSGHEGAVELAGSGARFAVVSLYQQQTVEARAACKFPADAGGQGRERWAQRPEEQAAAPPVIGSVTGG
jgi:hypothetical protein